jgi:hypothetical protein
MKAAKLPPERGMTDWHCIDCGTDTAPGIDPAKLARDGGGKANIDESSEVYWVRDHVWQLIGAPEGSLCIGCLEARLGYRLKRKDFPRYHPLKNPNYVLNDPTLPATPRLLARRK